MAAARRRKRRNGRAAAYPIGLFGLLCLGVSVIGLLRSPLEREGPEAVIRDTPGRIGEKGSAPYYPLAVGRYWVYVHQDPGSGVVTEVERRIVRRERRPDQELFFFSDGTVAYRQDGRIFEIGPEGGVNVIPVDSGPGKDLYIYRSQGLYIEKRIGARDTVVVLEGRRYSGCLQVITRFRRNDRPDDELRSYASYYAPGIGLVGREVWPRQREEAPSIALRDYGPQRL